MRMRVAEREFGDGAPAFLAAEIGINHNGDMDLARRMIEAAAESGADAVKFQNYRTEDFLSDRTLSYEYISRGERVVESQWEMFKRCELKPEALSQLREHADRAGVLFFSTPTSAEGVQDLLRVGVALLKNGSDYLGHLPLIQAMAKSGLPTVISTGMATVEDIDDAVDAYRQAGGRDLVLLHCTSAYPTPANQVNLRRMPALRERFHCATGLSDHSEGTLAAVGAVTLGACMIEKHFTLDKNLPGPDHRFSSDPDEFRQLVTAVRTVESQLGSAEIKPAAAEAEGRLTYKLSCVAARDLAAGHTIVESDLAFRRPGTGVPPKNVKAIVGRPIRHAVAAGQPIRLEDLQ